MKVFKLAKDDKLNYVKEIPSTTYGYQELKRTADTIYLYFLIDSSLCTVAYLSFWCIVYPHIYKTFTPAWSQYIPAFLTTFLVVCGLGSWLGIALLLRTYLYRLHDCWKRHSLKMLNEAYDKQAKLISHWEQDRDKEHLERARSKMQEIICTIDRLSQDTMSINKWEFATSMVALIANLAAAGITIEFFM